MLVPLCVALGTRQAGLSPPNCDNPLSDESTDCRNRVAVWLGKLFPSAMFDR